MAKESVLTTADKDAIKIEKLIFHIILKDQVAPIFLDKVIITENQQKFFKARLSDAAQGRQHVFFADLYFVLKQWRYFPLMMKILCDYLKK